MGEILRFKRVQPLADTAIQSERPPSTACESVRTAVNLALAGWLLLGAAWAALLTAAFRRDTKP